MTMTATPPQKPANTSPYASLRSTSAAGSETSSPQALPPTEGPGFAAELAKLEELRAALWQAFKAGPEAGLPTLLIELTNCYTNTLRFQLNMKALNAQKPASSHANATSAKTQI